MDDVHENIDDYNANRKRKILVVFDDMIVCIMSNNKFQTIIKELFTRCKKLNISLVFITQSYFPVPKDVRLSLTHHLSMKINNRKELQNTTINHSITKILWRFTKNSQENHNLFQQLILRYQQVILKNLEKVIFLLAKMTVTDQFKIIDNKIKANESQYDLDRLAAKISALSSNYE